MKTASSIQRLMRQSPISSTGIIALAILLVGSTPHRSVAQDAVEYRVTAATIQEGMSALDVDVRLSSEASGVRLFMGHPLPADPSRLSRTLVDRRDDLLLLDRVVYLRGIDNEASRVAGNQWQAEVPSPEDGTEWHLLAEVYDTSGQPTVLDTGRRYARATQDTEPPTIGTASVDPTSVDITLSGQTVTAQAQLLDNETGVTFAFFYLRHTTLDLEVTGFSTLTSGTSLDGIWESVVSIPRYSANGTWALEVEAYDGAFNTANLDGGVSVEVTGTADVTAPTLSGPESVSPSSVDLSSGSATVVVTAPFQDDVSGTTYVEVILMKGFEEFYLGNADLISGTAFNGTWELSTSVPQNTSPGVWTLVLTPQDGAGNSDRIVTSSTLTVSGGDTDPPVLSGTATIQPGQVDVSSTAQSITVTAPLQDASRVSTVDIVLVQEFDVRYLYGTSNLISGTLEDGTWEVTREVEPGTPNGTWDVYLSASDEVGNFTDELDTGLTLTVTGSDTSPPELVSSSVTPLIVDISGGNADVEVSVVLTDDVSGVDRAQVVWRQGFQVRSGGELTLTSGDALNGTWSGTAVVQADTPEGIWDVTVYAEDAIGNAATLVTEKSIQVGGSDTEAPQISSGPVADPTSVDVSISSQPLALSVELTDNGVGVSSVSFALRATGTGKVAAPMVDQIFVEASMTAGTTVDGTWEGTAQIPRNAEPGTWSVRVIASDNANNTLNVTTATTFDVIGGDVEAPALAGTPTIDPSSADVSGGPLSVSLSVPLSDNRSGVSYVNGVLLLGSDSRVIGFGTLSAGSSTNGVWQIDATIPQSIPVGIWTVLVDAGDDVGNSVRLDTGLEFEVTGSDTDPPAISDAAIDPVQVDVTTADAPVDVSVVVTDDASGAASVSIWFQRDFSSVYGGELTLASGTTLDGTWSGTASIPQATESGVYTLVFDVTDNAQNQRTITSSAILLVGINDNTAPVLSAFPTINPSPVDLAAGSVAITITAALTDTDAGVGAVDFTLELTAAGKAAAGPSVLTASAELVGGDPNVGTWTAELTVPQNAEPGTWGLDVRAEDRVGNILTTPDATTVDFSGSDPTAPGYPGGGSLTPVTIDVTDAAKTVVARIPLTDVGTGISDVVVEVRDLSGLLAASASASLESGDSRNGTWKADILVDGNAGQHEVFVNATDAAGNSVNVRTDLTLTVTIQPPTAAENPTPVNGQRQVAPTTTLRWSARAGRQYEVYLWPSVDPQPTTPLRTTENPEAEVTLQLATDYSWFVRTLNSAGSADGPIWTFKTESLPDLVVSVVNVATEQQVGQPLEVEWTVSNVGDVATTAGAWIDRIVLSFDDQLDNRDKRLGQRGNISFLDAGESYTNSASFDVSEEFVGSLYVFVKTDVVGSQPETNEGNNVTSEPVTFSLPPPSDLIVNSLAGPTDAFSGSTINVQWTVENQGSVVTNKDRWVDRLYLSPDSALNAETAIRLDSYERRAILDATATYVVQLEVELPAETFGAYWLVAVTDDMETVFEGINETNNALGRRIQIALTPPPDLVVSSVSAVGPAGSGQPLQVSWTVVNEGASPTRGRWVDRVYLSTSETFDSEQAAVLETVRSSETLDATEQYDRTRDVLLPNGASGDYFIFVAADTRNQVFEHTFEDNNVSSAVPINITLTPPPDLVASDLLVPQQIRQSAGFDLSWRMSNTGSTVAAGPWIDRIILSSSPNWTPESQLTVEDLAIIRQEQNLPSGADRRVSIRPRVGASFTGPAYVYVLLDADDQVYEGDQNANNVLRSSQITVQPPERPDLAVEITAFAAAAGSGDLVELSWTVSNSGGPARGYGWRDAVWLSADGVLGADDTLLDEIKNIQYLQGEGQYQRTERVAIPNGLSGDFFFVVQADASSATADADRSNNTAVSGAVTITETPPANLVVTSFTSSEPPVSGQTQQVRWTVQNEGTTTTRNTDWVDTIWLSRDGLIDDLDIRVGYAERSTVLAPDESYTVDTFARLPLFWSGESHLILRTDEKNVEYESDEMDNVVLLPQTVVRPAPSDLIVENVVADATVEAGNAVNVSWTVRNTSLNPANGTMTEGIYLSADPAWDNSDPLVGTINTAVDLAPGEQMKMKAAIDLVLLDNSQEAGVFSGDTPGVLPGDYRLIVRTDNRNNIPETDDTNNAAAAGDVTVVTIPTFTLGETIQDTWETGQVRYYCLNVGEGLDLRLSMESQRYPASQIYVAYDRVPTPFDHDVAATDVSSLTKDLVVPSTTAGSYYVMLRAQSEATANTDDLSFTAQALSFEVREAVPAAGGQGGFVTGRIRGAGFREGGTAVLRDATGREIAPAEITFVNTTEAKVRWNLAEAGLGLYDVVVKRPDETEAILEDGFEVELPTAAELKINRVIPRALLANRPERYVILVTNTSNNDIEVGTMQIDLPGDAQVEVSSSGGFLTRTQLVPDSLREEVENLSDFVVSEDFTLRSVPLVARNFPPGATSTIEITFFVARGTDQFPTRITTRTFTQAAFIEEMLTKLEAGRQLILASPDDFDPEVVDLAQDAKEYARVHLNHAVSLGLIDADAVDAGLTTLQAIQRSVRNRELVLALTGAASIEPLLAANVLLSCEDFFRATGCALAVVGCATAVTGVGAILCVAGLVACGTGWELEEGGIIGCLDPASAVNCLAQELLCNDIVGSFDPNDILGPEGFGDKRWIARSAVLGYTIRFENDPDLATAPARDVRITHPLDSLLDIRTFRLGPFGFAGLHFDVPEGNATYTARLDVRDSLGLFVDVTAGVDVTTGRAFWNFVSIDPATGLSPENPFDGFLALNDSLGSGEGFISYTIRSAKDAVTGDIVDAEARIVFDLNAPINTPAIFNTVDADLPSSRIALADAIDPGRWQVNWSGEDVGSGVRDYRLYVSEDETNFRPVRAGITDETITFAGEPDRSYYFYTIASDNTGNVESTKSEAEITVDVEDLTEVPEHFALYQGYPNPFNPTIAVPFDLASTGRVEIRMFDVLGRLVRTYQLGEMQPGRYEQQMNLRSFASGVYVYEIRVTDATRMLFHDVRKAVLVK